MVPLFLIGYAIITPRFIKGWKEMKAWEALKNSNEYPLTPDLYDFDLDQLSKAESSFKETDFGPGQKFIFENFTDEELNELDENWLKEWCRQFHTPGTIRSDDEDLDEERRLWDAIKPITVRWCNGFKLRPCDYDDLSFFRDKIVKDAYEKQEYDSLPFFDGGLDRLFVDWFVMKGCTPERAEQLWFEEHIKPWDWQGCDFL